MSTAPPARGLAGWLLAGEPLPRPPAPSCCVAGSGRAAGCAAWAAGGCGSGTSPSSLAATRRGPESRWEKRPPALLAVICPGEPGRGELRGRLALSRGAEDARGGSRCDVQLTAGGREHQGTAQRGAAVPSAVTETWEGRSGEPSPKLAGDSGGEEQVAGGHEEGGWPVLPCPSRTASGFSPADGLSGSSEVGWAFKGLWSNLFFGCHRKGKLSLGQFAEHFYLYEISLWLPEGKEISKWLTQSNTREMAGSSVESSLT